MSHHVYAKDREIASKSSNGKATLPPVDFCWTPPTSPATPTGVPIPYPNLCKCPNITNGTRTVFIKRKMVGMEDKSYVSTSTGNEPATEALQKGIISHKIKGKGYFRFWMLTVKVEGAGVPRHGDPVSNNHGSPPNSGGDQEISTQTKKPECTAKEDIDKACSSKDKPPASAEALKRDEISKADRMPDLEETPRNAWMHQHCDGLWTKPGVPFRTASGVERKNLLP